MAKRYQVATKHAEALFSIVLESAVSHTEFETNAVYGGYSLLFGKMLGNLLAQILDVRVNRSFISISIMTLNKESDILSF
jgi:hypothetical protein